MMVQILYTLLRNFIMTSKLLFDGILFALTREGWKIDVVDGDTVAFLHLVDTIIKVWVDGHEVRVCDADNLESKSEGSADGSK